MGIPEVRAGVSDEPFELTRLITFRPGVSTPEESTGMISVMKPLLTPGRTGMACSAPWSSWYQSCWMSLASAPPGPRVM